MNYVPSYSSNPIQTWQDYDPATVERELVTAWRVWALALALARLLDDAGSAGEIRERAERARDSGRPVLETADGWKLRSLLVSGRARGFEKATLESVQRLLSLSGLREVVRVLAWCDNPGDSGGRRLCERSEFVERLARARLVECGCVKGAKQ